MYFAPALEDLCIKWDVPKRTAAALFVALANGAPDLAATGYMFKQGQGDMAFGALLGAGAYVCMNVIGMIILFKPKAAMQATPALLRDILSFLGILCFLFPIFMSGLTWKWVVILNGTYAVLTGAVFSCLLKACLPQIVSQLLLFSTPALDIVMCALSSGCPTIDSILCLTDSSHAVAIFCGDEWHKRGRPPIFASLLSRTRSSGAFEPLAPSDTLESDSSSPSNFELLDQWAQPSSPPPLPTNFSS